MYLGLQPAETGVSPIFEAIRPWLLPNCMTVLISGMADGKFATRGFLDCWNPKSGRELGRLCREKHGDRYGHHIRHHIGQYVLEYPAVHSLPAGGRPAGDDHDSVGGRFNAGAPAG